jgi:hypothetical protein
MKDKGNEFNITIRERLGSGGGGGGGGGGGDAPCNYAPIADEYHSLHDASNPNWKFGGPKAPLFA